MLDTYGPHEVIWLIDKLTIKKVKSILQYWWQNLAHINATKKVITSILKQNTLLKLHHQCLSSLVSQIYTESSSVIEVYLHITEWILFLSRTVPDNKEVMKQQMSGSSFILKELSHILWGPEGLICEYIPAEEWGWKTLNVSRSVFVQFYLQKFEASTLCLIFVPYWCFVLLRQCYKLESKVYIEGKLEYSFYII